jgi:hypothetical protein
LKRWTGKQERTALVAIVAVLFYLPGAEFRRRGAAE